FLITLEVFLVFAHARVLDGFWCAFGRFFYAVLESPFPLVFLLVTAAVTVYTGVLYFVHREPAPPVPGEVAPSAPHDAPPRHLARGRSTRPPPDRRRAPAPGRALHLGLRPPLADLLRHPAHARRARRPPPPHRRLPRHARPRGALARHDRGHGHGRHPARGLAGRPAGAADGLRPFQREGARPRQPDRGAAGRARARRPRRGPRLDGRLVAGGRRGAAGGGRRGARRRGRLQLRARPRRG